MPICLHEFLYLSKGDQSYSLNELPLLLLPALRSTNRLGRSVLPTDPPSIASLPGVVVTFTTTSELAEPFGAAKRFSIYPKILYIRLEFLRIDLPFLFAL